MFFFVKEFVFVFLEIVFILIVFVLFCFLLLCIFGEFVCSFLYGMLGVLVLLFDIEKDIFKFFIFKNK